MPGTLIAHSSRQLGLCLKLLYAEKREFIVRVEENSKRKINFVVVVMDIEAEDFEILSEKYRILIS